MSSDWPMVRLGNHCEKIGSGATPKGGKSVYLDLGETALIRSQNVYNEGFTASGLAFISEEAADKLKNVSIESNDILLNITGDSVARVCMAPEEYLPARVNQHVAIIRPDNSRLDSRFVRYFLSSPEQQRSLLTIASSGATRNALTKSHIEQLEVPMPGLEIQQAIANQLETLDKKIKLNHQINQTLEQMAQAIFKSWFVDFEPVKAKMAALEAGGSEEDALIAAMQAISGKGQGQLARFKTEQPEQYNELRTTAELFPTAMQDSELGEIPEGWGINQVSSEVEILNGFAFKSGDYVSAPGVFVLRTRNFNECGVVERMPDDVFLPKSFKESYKKYLCEPYDYHLVMVGASVGKTATIYPCDIPALRNQNMWCFRPKSKSVVGRAFTKYMGDNLALKLKGVASGSAREFFRKGDFQKHLICFATESIHKSFEQQVFSLMKQQANNVAESRSLAAIRDNLLPKLLSGKLKV